MTKGTAAHERVRIPIWRIKNDFARRLAMIVAFPLLSVWYFNWRLLVLPFAIAWNAIEAASAAICESVYDDFHTRSMQLIAAGWRLMWNESAPDYTPTLSKTETVPDHITTPKD